MSDRQAKILGATGIAMALIFTGNVAFLPGLAFLCFFML